MARAEAAPLVPPSPLRSAVALALGILGVLILGALGTWQVERLQWKEGIIRQIDERTNSPPRPIDEIEALQRRTGDVEYYPVALRGRFLNGAERFFLSTHAGEAGWNVYVPLDLGQNRFVFVNRGFVPYDLRDPAKRAEGQIEGEAAVAGLARNAAVEKPGWMIPDNDLAKNQFFWKSIAQMSTGAGLPAGAEVLPFVVDAGPGRAPGGWPVGGTTVIDIPNNHLQYALTWYGLALALAVMLGVQAVKALRTARAGRGRG